MVDKQINYYTIGQVKVSVTNLDEVIQTVVKKRNEKSKYICVGNVRTTVLGNKNKSYRDIINGSFMNLPDGMPLVWAGRLAGAKQIQRSSGPDLFSEFMKDKYNVRHFFLGDSELTLNALIEKIKRIYPETTIAGHYSPPFKPLEEFDFEKIANIIKQSNADIIWVAVGAPKQDFLSSELVKYCEKGIFIGVGAAFRFFLGEYSHPPRIFQIIGMEGVFWRFFKNPLTEFIWYVKHIPQYLWLLTKLKYNDIL